MAEPQHAVIIFMAGVKIDDVFYIESGGESDDQKKLKESGTYFGRHLARWNLFPANAA